MTLGARLRHLLAFLLMLGVGAIPLAARAADFGSATPEATAAMQSMADGMPCCPDDAPAMPDCQKSCPLMAGCMTACVLAAPIAIVVDANRTVVLAAVLPGDEQARAGPVSGPPSRPPRS